MLFQGSCTYLYSVFKMHQRGYISSLFVFGLRPKTAENKRAAGILPAALFILESESMLNSVIYAL